MTAVASPVRSEPDAARRSAAAHAQRKVLPAVEVGSGVVLLPGPGGTERRRCAQAAELAAALSRAVARPMWEEGAGVLVVRVAAAGFRSGRPVEFRLDRSN